MKCSKGLKIFNILSSLGMGIAGIVTLYKSDYHDITSNQYSIHLILSVVIAFINIFGLISLCGFGCDKINFLVNIALNIGIFIYNYDFWNNRPDSTNYENYENIENMLLAFIIYQGILVISYLLLFVVYTIEFSECQK